MDNEDVVYVYTHTHTHTHVYTYMHTMEYYSALKKKEILLFATKWMDLEGITISERSQRKTNTSHQQWGIRGVKGCKLTVTK